MKDTFGKTVDITITVVAILAAIYHLLSTQFLFQSFLQHENNHFMFCILLVFLAALSKNLKRWPFYIILILLGMAATGYVKVFFSALQERAEFPTNLDLVVGVVLIVVGLEASRQAFGLAIPLLAAIGIAYDFFGHYLPDPFYHAKFTFDYLISNLSIGLEGMYGTALAVSVNYIFLFFLFGGILQKSGAVEFFASLGRLAGRRLRGGPAQMAVVSSAFVGSVIGSAVANVAITGSFTIPLMKKAGFKPAQAGAIEACASTGGQIMPPIMGAAAFLMVGVTGIPYVEIMTAALIPSLLFFLSVGIYVELEARSRGIVPDIQKIDVKQFLIQAPCFVLPLGILVVLLAMGYTAMFCAFWATVSLIAVNFLTEFIIKRKVSIGWLLEGIRVGAIGGAGIGATAASLGFLLSSITMTGIGVKLSALIAEWSGGVLLLACIITMVVSILFGMGVPTMVAYALVAFLGAPALIRLGVSMLQAHLFCLFFAVFSNLTPPIAISALVASGIAKSSYLKTSMQSFKIAVVSFMIPYVFIWNPSIIMVSAGLMINIMTILAIVLAILAMAVVITKYYLTEIKMLERIAFLTVAILLLGYVFSLHVAFLIVGIALIILLTFWQMRFRNMISQKV